MLTKHKCEKNEKKNYLGPGSLGYPRDVRSRPDWPMVLDISRESFPAQERRLLHPPPPPLAFFDGHEFGHKLYSVGSDRELLAPRYRSVFFTAFGTLQAYV